MEKDGVWSHVDKVSKAEKFPEIEREVEFMRTEEMGIAIIEWI